jgi:Pyruvate/2-oxoacid:ferredoxin oxidoreductase gamma subunit
MIAKIIMPITGNAMPEAMAANANLYVSAENSNFSNKMVGPQVVEVVVIDDDINETNEAKGEPDVTINGNKLRMAQATDGYWYGYFAEKTQAQ